MKLKDYVIVILVSILTVVLSHQSNIAAEGSFANLIPIDGPGGAIRFFDRSTGIMYTYDSTLQEVTRIMQLEEIGEPAKEILAPKEEKDMRYTNPMKGK